MVVFFVYTFRKLNYIIYMWNTNGMADWKHDDHLTISPRICPDMATLALSRPIEWLRLCWQKNPNATSHILATFAQRSNQGQIDARLTRRSPLAYRAGSPARTNRGYARGRDVGECRGLIRAGRCNVISWQAGARPGGWAEGSPLRNTQGPHEIFQKNFCC